MKLSQSAAAWIRRVSGVLSVIGLGAMAMWSYRPQALDLPGVVEASERFAVSVDADAVWWTRSTHGHAEGLRVIEQGSLQMERGEQLTVEVLVDSGAVVSTGEPLARVDSQLLDRVIGELDAERAGLEARLELLQDGGRPEAIAAAQKRVDVRRAELESAKLLADRMNRAGATAVSQAQIDTANAAVAVAERQLALAQAWVIEARQPARPGEISDLNAQLASVDSRLLEARRRQAASVVTAPSDGRAGMPRPGELLAINGLGPHVVRVPVPQGERERIAVGASVSFVPEQADPVPGHVVDIATEAMPMGDQAVFWVAVQLEADAIPGTTGRALFTEGS